MEERQIAKAPIQQQDGVIKDRPVLLLKKLPYLDDWLVCGISSKTFREIKGFDVLIDRSHPDYEITRLQYEGLIRLGFLASLSEKQMKGAIGEISRVTHKKLMNNLIKLLRTK